MHAQLSLLLGTTRTSLKGGHIMVANVCYWFALSSVSGMNQFGQMGMQSLGQRSTPPLPLGGPLNQVSRPLSF